MASVTHGWTCLLYTSTWEGIAVWPYLGTTFKGLKNEGALMTGSAYPGMWDFEYIPGDMMSMAETYSKV